MRKIRSRKPWPERLAGLWALIVSAAIPGVIGVDPASGQERGDTGVEYRPPEPDAPRARVVGRFRGGAHTLVIHAVAPDHVGLSATPTPTLFWHLSEATDQTAVFSLTRHGDDEPLVRWSKRGVAGGLHAVELGRWTAGLTPEVDYDWAVAIVTDPDARSKDDFAKGMVRYRPLEKDQSRRLRFEGAADRIAHYAGSGYWYDAVDEARRLAQASPEPGADTGLLGLLKQGGLESVAEALRADESPTPPLAATKLTGQAPDWSRFERGAPSRTVPGGVRAGGSGVAPVALAASPPEVNALYSTTPVFHAYIPETDAGHARLTLNQRASPTGTIIPEPLVQIDIHPPRGPRILEVALSDFGIELERGASYEWVLAFPSDPDAPSSKDPLVAVYFRCAEANADLERTLASAEPGSRIERLLEAGYWCDALGSLTELIRRNPDDPGARRWRAGMLRAAGFEGAALWDERWETEGRP